MCFIYTGSHFEFVKCVPTVFDFICSSPELIVVKNESGIFVYHSADYGLVAFRLNHFFKNKEEVNK